MIIPAGTPKLTINDIRTGLIFNFTRLTNEEQYQQLYHNNLSSLFQGPKTDINGLSMLGEEGIKDIVKINWFRRITETLVDSMFSEPPRGLDSELVSKMANASRWSSMKGVGVLAAERGRIFDVDPSLFFPLFDSNKKFIVGSLITHLFHHGPYSPNQLPNMLEATICTDDIKKRLVYNFSGQQLNELVLEEESPVCGVYTFGKGFSDYVDVIPILKELMIRFTLFSKVLNRHSNPHLEGPTDLLNPEAPSYDPNGMYLPLSSMDTPPYKYLVWDASMEAANSQINRLLDELHIATGLPATYFGISRVGGDSGVSRERQMIGLLQRVRNLRREIEKAVISASEAAGTGIQTLTWPDDPFSSFFDRVNAEVAMIGAGITEAEESKKRLLGG